ncbi:MAG: hypothetical protein D9C04_03490, partial [Nitrosopumilus sp. B06]
DVDGVGSLSGATERARFENYEGNAKGISGVGLQIVQVFLVDIARITCEICKIILLVLQGFLANIARRTCKLYKFPLQEL